MKLDQFSSQSHDKSKLHVTANFENTLVKFADKNFNIYLKSPVQWQSQQALQVNGNSVPSLFLKGGLNVNDLYFASEDKTLEYRVEESLWQLSLDLSPNKKKSSQAQANIKSELDIYEPSFFLSPNGSDESEVLRGAASKAALQLIQRFTIDEEGKPTTSSGSGRFSLDKVQINLEKNELSYKHDLFSTRWSIKLPDIEQADWQKMPQINSRIQLDNVQIFDLQQNVNLIQLPKITLKDIELNGINELKISNINLDSPKLLQTESTDKQEPVLSLSSLELDQLVRVRPAC